MAASRLVDRQHLAHRRSECMLIPRRDKPAGLARNNQLRNPGNEGGDNRPPQRHGFHNRDRQAFRDARQHHGGGAPEFSGHALARRPASDGKLGRQAELLGLAFDFRPQRAVAGEDEGKRRPS